MMQPVRPFRRRVGSCLHTFTVEPVAGRWYAEARLLGTLFAAGSGDTPGEALAFVPAVLAEPAGRAAA